MKYRTRSAKREATYEDVLAAPEHMIAEIIDGELVLSPRPAPPHAYSSSILGGELNGPGRPGSGGKGPRGWFILYEPELHLGRNVLVPDLAGWRRERMAALPRTAYFTLAPDWACEVISPSSQRHDRLAKMHIYARAEVGHVWLVDPLAQMLEVFALQHGLWVRVLAAEGDETVRAEPFAELELSLANWWAPLEDEPPPPEQAAEPEEEAGART